MRGIPAWVYAMERVDLRTWFMEWGELWRPWEVEADALGAVESLKERGVGVRVRTWSGKTAYADLSEPVKAAVQRYRLPHEAGKRGPLWGVEVGVNGWAIAPTFQEAVGRAVMYAARRKEI